MAGEGNGKAGSVKGRRPRDLRNVVWVGDPDPTMLTMVGGRTDPIWSNYIPATNQHSGISSLMESKDILEQQLGLSIAATLLLRAFASIGLPQERARAATNVLTLIHGAVQQSVNAQVGAKLETARRPSLIIPGKPGVQ
jgi:hypothetical protein